MRTLHRSRAFFLLIALGTVGVGCNALTGADDLVIGDEPRGAAADDDDDDDDDDGGRSTDGDGDGGAAAATSGAGSTTGSGPASGAGAGSSGSGTQMDLADVPGVAISDVAFYQGVEARVLEDGQLRDPAVPIVAGRDALVRVFPTLSGYDGQPVLARLILEGQPPIEQELTLQTPDQASLASTVNFEVPAAAIVAGARFRVEIKRPGAPGVETGSSYPAGGSFAPTGAQSSGRLKITLVPVQYGADGSDRMPDTSQAMLDAYRDHFGATYPASELDVTVGSPVTWNSTVAPNGSGWDSLLNAIADHRAGEGAAFDEYYYGIFNPAGSVQAYCGGGCVAGLGFLGGTADDYVRAAIGLGFGGEMSTGTAVHELGHNHGRDHAPCGTGGDPGFPHPGAQIGEWGHDRSTGQLKAPDAFVDFMSYCEPAWISDYTYSALLDRIQAVHGMDMYVPEESRFRSYERISVGLDGATWLPRTTIERPPIGARRTLRVTGDDGVTRSRDAAFFPYDHVEGGLYLFEASPVGAKHVEIDLHQRRLEATR